MNTFKRLIHEVHRRSLWQVLAIYLAGSWIAFEVIDGLTDALNLPDWLPAFAIALFIIGLPIVLATAFVQEGPPRAGRDGAETEVPGDAAGPALARGEPPGTAPPPGTGQPGEEPPAAGRGAGGVPATTRQAGAPASPAASGGTQPLAPAGPTGAHRLFTWRNAILGGVLAFALWGVIAAGWLLFGEGDGADAPAPVSDDVIAVVPFRVSGADPALGYLREGMIDLLAAKLTGEAGPRAADPRSVMSAWRTAVSDSGGDLSRRATLVLARDLGAQEVLLGGVVGTPANVVLNASVVEVSSGETTANTSVEGPADSLPALVDRMAATLLALEAGEEQYRLAALTSGSLPALRAYLLGQAAYRDGRYGDALEHFDEALQHDSTFALAGLGMANTSNWFASGPGSVARGVRVAWGSRERLSARDRAYVRAVAGPNYPAPSSMAERLDAWREARRLAPDDPEVWHRLADTYFHWGKLLGYADAEERAIAGFERTLELDPRFMPSLQHLIQLQAYRGDTAVVKELAGRYLDTGGEAAEAVRWWRASALGDTAAIRRMQARMEDAAGQNLPRIVQWSIWTGRHMDAATAAADEGIERGRAGEAPRFTMLLYAHDLALTRGRPTRALELIAELRGAGPGEGAHLMLQVLDGVFADGDSVAAARAAELFVQLLDDPRALGAMSRPSRMTGLTFAELWRLFQGNASTAARSIELLRDAADESESDPPNAIAPLHLQADLVEATLAVLQGDPDASGRVQRLDSIARTVPGSNDFGAALINVVVGRLYEALGRQQDALRVFRRRPFFYGAPSTLPAALEGEGRTAAALGRTDDAIRAYRHYLALRNDPEPEVEDEVERVRRALAELVDEPAP